MLSTLEISPLQDRRRQLRLAYFYKVVEGLVPALPPEHFLTPIRTNKRPIRAKQFTDFVAKNIVVKHQTLNSRAYQTIQTKTTELENSFFPRTIVEWNQLSESTVRAPTIEAFKAHLLA